MNKVTKFNVFLKTEDRKTATLNVDKIQCLTQF